MKHTIDSDWLDKRLKAGDGGNRPAGAEEHPWPRQDRAGRRRASPHRVAWRGCQAAAPRGDVRTEEGMPLGVRGWFHAERPTK